MKKKILVTGAPGAGKSAVSTALRNLGYEAYDIETIKGLFEMCNAETGEVYKKIILDDPERIKNAKWICNTDKVKEILSQQKNDIAFYCGVSSEAETIMPFFDQTILLQTTPEIIHKRLSVRDGIKGKLGNTEELRQIVLDWKNEWEKRMTQKKNVIVIDASGEIDEVAKKILKATL